MRQAAERGADIGRHAPAKTFDLAAQRTAWCCHDEDRRALPRLDPVEVSLTEVADRVPLLGVDDGEEWVASGRKFSSSDFERSDPTIAGCAHGCLVQVALREAKRRPQTFQLCLGGLDAGDGLVRLSGLQLRLLVCNLRCVLGRTRLVDLLGGYETA